MTQKISEVTDPDQCLHMVSELTQSARRSQAAGKRDAAMQSMNRAMAWMRQWRKVR